MRPSGTGIISLLRGSLFVSGLRFLLLFALICVPAALRAEQELTQENVSLRVAEMIAYLRKIQDADGTYNYGGNNQLGATALVLLALLSAGVSQKDPAALKAANFLMTHTVDNTYEEALVACALEKIDAEQCRKRIKFAADFLESCQAKSGGWRYGNASNADRGSSDMSCSQYAILGLAAAERSGVELNPAVKALAKRYFSGMQNIDGSWPYMKGSNGTENMTCAGLASLALLGEKVETPGAHCGEYRQNQAMSKGLEYLGRKLKPFLRDVPVHNWGYYGLYGLERTGILLEQRQIGDIDWYAEGCRVLLSSDNWKKSAVDSAFALLFITRNDAPYAITKWRWRGDWNNDRNDVSGWIREATTQLKRPLDWQTASLENGLGSAGRSSMIFLSGHGKFTASDKELASLRKFLEMGGVIVGEACCDSPEFQKSFQDFMEKRLSLESGLKFMPVPSTHPVRSSVHKLDVEDMEGVLMLGKGCSRKQVFLLSRDISCSFNGEEQRQAIIERSKKLGVNLLAYALGRRKPQAKFSDVSENELELQERLMDKARAGSRAAFAFESPLGRLKHDGDWTTDPSFFSGLSAFLKKDPALPSFDGEVAVAPETDEMFAFPALLLTGHAAPTMSPESLVNLRRYLQGGGFVLVDACCSDANFDAAFRKIAASLWPGQELRQIPKDDPIYKYPFDLGKQKPTGSNAYTLSLRDSWLTLWGLSDGRRWVLVYSPTDLSCGIEGDLEQDIKGLSADAALPLLANIFYAGLALETVDKGKDSGN